MSSCSQSHGGYHPRTPGAKPSGVVKECDLFYENFDVEDIYERWDNIVPEEQRAPIRNIMRGIVNRLSHLKPGEDASTVYKKELRMMAREHKIMPRKAWQLHMYKQMITEGELPAMKVLKDLLITRASKSTSGVLVVTVLTSPYPIVNGKKQRFSCEWNCYYCPNQPGQPRSYLRDEPAVLRANQNGFDAVMQFTDRCATLAQNGHPVDKIELLVLGGTWESYPREYQEGFVRDLFYAANTIFERKKRPRFSLEEEQSINETAECKIIGVTLETRPDTINPEEIQRLRRFGCTRVQLGVQHTDDGVLDYINRQCTTAKTIRAISLLKNSCFKIDIHLMPNLPGSNPDMDDEMFDRVLYDPDLQVDQWKIYPCEVVPWSMIKKWYDEGKFTPYPDPTLIDVICRAKNKVHPWIRLNRVVRDIPSQYILGGIDYGNMRQDLPTIMKAKGLECSCIRCREVKGNKKAFEKGRLLMKREYMGSNSREVFISFETPDTKTIFGFCRLRLPSGKEGTTVFPELKNAALVRELHVYGKLMTTTGLDRKNTKHAQHVGFGRRMMAEAERIAALNGYSKVAVIAGVGTREYYKKLGYRFNSGKGQFMMKRVYRHKAVVHFLMGAAGMLLALIVAVVAMLGAGILSSPEF